MDLPTVQLKSPTLARQVFKSHISVWGGYVNEYGLDVIVSKIMVDVFIWKLDCKTNPWCFNKLVEWLVYISKGKVTCVGVWAQDIQLI